MRVFVLVLMMTLLPVRGWVGDAMAMSLADGHAQAVVCADHGNPADLSTAPTADADTEATHAKATHQHNACDLCNGPAMAATIGVATSNTTVQPMHVSTVEPFASAVVPQGIKPPIA